MLLLRLLFQRVTVESTRQLYGLTIASEREKHRLYEQWQPLGPVGIITAFNLPVAVWSWNALIAAVAGDAMIWKPSSVTPLTAIAVQKIVDKVIKEQGVPEGIFNLLVSQGSTVGQHLVLTWNKKNRGAVKNTAPRSS